MAIENDMLASCADNGSLILTNLQTNRQDHICKHEFELKKVLFLQPYKILLASDAHSTVMFFTTKNTPSKEKLLVKKNYRTNNLTNQKLDAPVQAVAFYI